jgi:hypothetical protein
MNYGLSLTETQHQLYRAQTQSALHQVHCICIPQCFFRLVGVRFVPFSGIKGTFIVLLLVLIHCISNFWNRHPLGVSYYFLG